MNSEGTRPSDVASWMLEPTAGLLMEDLLPRMQRIEALTQANERRHLSQPMTVVYDCCFFCESMSASRL